MIFIGIDSGASRITRARTLEPAGGKGEAT